MFRVGGAGGLRLKTNRGDKRGKQKKGGVTRVEARMRLPTGPPWLHGRWTSRGNAGCQAACRCGVETRGRPYRRSQSGPARRTPQTEDKRAHSVCACACAVPGSLASTLTRAHARTHTHAFTHARKMLVCAPALVIPGSLASIHTNAHARTHTHSQARRDIDSKPLPWVLLWVDALVCEVPK